MTELHVVAGPPCSGKSRHIADHAGPRDVVIDADALARALGYPHRHIDWWERPAHPARGAAMTARASLIRQASGGRLRGDVVWLVDSQPSPESLAHYQAIGATVTTLDPGAAECHRRADAAGRSPATHEQIDRWYAESLGVTSTDW